MTPLHWACFKGYLPIVQYLIGNGANIEAKQKDQWTPLHYASSYGQTDVVKYLISIGANKNSKDKSGKTPFDVVCDSISNQSQREVVKELLK